MCVPFSRTLVKGSAMAFKRNERMPAPLTGSELTSAMVGIGMNFAFEPAPNPNIEDILFSASYAGLERDDLRVLSVLVTWIGVHSEFINADRLWRAVRRDASVRVRAFWSAIGHWRSKDRRFGKLASVYSSDRISLLGSGQEFQIKRKGEDVRFGTGPLVVPAGVLRDRPGDVETPASLVKHHNGYRARVMMGPSYRADMWAMLELEPGLSTAELARRTYGSFATAWQVKRDFELLAA